jgi:hypothetical protein
LFFYYNNLLNPSHWFQIGWNLLPWYVNHFPTLNDQSAPSINNIKQSISLIWAPSVIDRSTILFGTSNLLANLPDAWSLTIDHRSFLLETTYNTSLNWSTQPLVVDHRWFSLAEKLLTNLADPTIDHHCWLMKILLHFSTSTDLTINLGTSWLTWHDMWMLTWHDMSS